MTMIPAAAGAVEAAAEVPTVNRERLVRTLADGSSSDREQREE